MTQDRSDDPKTSLHPHAILQAENGDIVRYDETGLVMRLSDRVVEDIASRLGAKGWSGAAAQSGPAGETPAEDADVELPETLDAWSVRRDGEWLRFTANPQGKSGPRGFMCKGLHGTVVADTPTPLLGLFAIGGSRASVASTIPCDYPHHIVAPGDDIGAVGLDGEEEAKSLATVHPLREMSHEALVAQALLNNALARRHALPLFFVRAETDGSQNAAGLAKGMAFENLVKAVRNMRAAATDMGKRGEILGVFLDFSLEDVVSSADAYRDGMIEVMENISRAFSNDGIPAPRFFSFFECGTRDATEDSTLEGQWQLAWNNAGHDLSIIAPSYMFALDQDGRLTDASYALRAGIAAEAVALTRAGEPWRCPVLHLAECDGKVLRVTAQCEGALVLDQDDPFGAGPHYGFALEGVGQDTVIEKVEIDPEDPKALLITCSTEIAGAESYLRYASGRQPVGGAGYPSNCGSLRDDYAAALHHEETLYSAGLVRRWALPARLKIN